MVHETGDFSCAGEHQPHEDGEDQSAEEGASRCGHQNSETKEAQLAADEELHKGPEKLSIELRSRTWASARAGPKCRYVKFASTCCNTDKRNALNRARDIKKKEMEEKSLKYEDDSYDVKPDSAPLEQVCKEIAASKSLPAPPSFEKPAGGQVDELITI